MDFYIDIGAAVLLRVLKERKREKEYRAIFVKLYCAIERAFAYDREFQDAVERARL